jgi:hypothetical protein
MTDSPLTLTTWSPAGGETNENVNQLNWARNNHVDFFLSYQWKVQP